MADPSVNLIFKAVDQTKGVIGGIGNALAGLGKIALGAAAGGIAAIGAGLAISVKEAMDAQAIQAQLATVLKSTGGAAGVTAEQANNLASSLSGVTRFSDDAVLSGENILLTFTNIGKNVFPQTTQTMLDMSQALGQDLQSSAIQLGKALQDPVDGVSALQRVGVNFTDSQKKMIESLVKAGKTEEAQKLILKELQTEFGGSAQAAGATFAGQLDILRNSLLNVAEGVGMSLLPILQAFIQNVLTPAMPVIQAFGDAIVKAFEFLAGGGSIGDAIGLIAVSLRDMLPVEVVAGIINFGETIDTVIIPALTSMGDWIMNVGLPAFLQFAGAVWEQLGPGLAQLGTWIQEIAAVVLPLLAQAVQFVIDNFNIFGPILAVIGAAILALTSPITLVIGAVVLLVTAWANNWGGIQEKVQAVWAFLQPVFETIRAWLATNLPVAIETLRGFWENVLLPAITKIWSFINTNLIPLFKALGELFDVTLKLAITALAGLWEKVLYPAIEKIWALIQDKALPIFKDVTSWLSDKLKPAFDGIANAIQSVISWIEDLIEKFKNIKLPDWLTPGSPTPFEMGLRGIADAMSDLNRAQLPQFKSNLAGIGAQGRMMGGIVNNSQTFNLTAQYGYQRETSLSQDVRMLQLLYGQ